MLRRFGIVARIAAAYLIACLVAGLTVAAPFVIVGASEQAIRETINSLGGVGLIVSVFVLGVTGLPAVGVISYAERQHVRSLRFYVTAGLITGAVSFPLVSALAMLRDPTPWTLTGAGIVLGLAVSLFAVAGVAAGVIYWGIAGRAAGACCERPSPAG